MIIKRIVLNNFRNHTDTDISFTKGINLLYGKNGSGKTSILEAIGFALFSGKFRTTNAEAVKEGTKKGKIYLEFSVDEQETFVVEKNLPSGTGVLYSKENSSLKLTNKEDILRKIRELLGIRIDSENFFSNIIVASQNKITDIFTGTANEKKARFDRLFDTEIYSNIANGYLKLAEGNYNNEHAKLADRLKDLNSILLDPKELDKSILLIKSIIEENLTKQGELVNKIIEIEKVLENQRTYKLGIENLNETIITNNERMEEGNERFINLNQQLSKSRISLEIVNSCKEDYDKYNALKTEISQFEEQVNSLEKETKKLVKIQKKLSENSNKINFISSEKIEKENRIMELSDEINNYNSIIDKSRIDIENLKNQASDVTSKYNKLETLKQIIELEENHILESEQKYNNNSIEINSISKNRINDSVFEQDNIKLLSEIDNLNPLFENKDGLNKLLSEISIRLEENSTAHKTLSNGVCPYLSEECLNIKKGSSIDEYFLNKSNELDKQIIDINNKLLQYSDLDNQLNLLRSKISKNEQSLENNKLLGHSLNELSNENEKIKLIIEKSKLQLNLIIEKNLDIISICELSNLDIDSKKINAKLDSMNFDIKQLNINYNDRLNVLNNIIIDQSKRQSSVSDLKVRVDEIIDLISTYNKENEKFQTEIIYLESKIVESDNLKERVEKLKNNLKNLSDSYTNYISNLDSANNINAIENELLTVKSNNLNLEKKSKELLEKLIELNSLFNEELFNSISLSLLNAKSEKAAIDSILNNNQVELRLLEDKINNNNSNLLSIKSIGEEISLLNNKINLTSELRSNLKMMGQIIANKLLERIQILATVNYKLISGRNESILWKSDISEAYQVGLQLLNKTNRNFELLSGGEQMMVAISLRAAMNTLLTNSRFVIFDEPTVNLDTERRSALSESLNHILQSLDQALIVTHDGTFMELAENIIEL